MYRWSRVGADFRNGQHWLRLVAGLDGPRHALGRALAGIGREQVAEHLPETVVQRKAGVIGDKLVLLGTGSDLLGGPHRAFASPAQRPPHPVRDQPPALGVHRHRGHPHFPMGYRAVLATGQGRTIHSATVWANRPPPSRPTSGVPASPTCCSK